jgi:cyclopropane-fatty-acyl-phospholipid synthase
MSIDIGRPSEPAIDRQRWPDVATVPHRAVRAAVVARLIAPGATRLAIRVVLPDGTAVGSIDTFRATLRLHRPEAFYHRVAADGLIGFGEAYQAGDWDADDLPALITVFAAHAGKPPRWLRMIRQLYARRPTISNNDAVATARRNIEHHYDLSNALFGLFLDETMTYSSAMFETDDVGQPIASWQLLVEAQRRKIDRVLDLARVGQRTRLLEVGTGWGELAIAAARRGAEVHSVTLSRRQCELARQRAAAAGVADQVRVEICDYRSIRSSHDGGYDAIVSVEMIEAVNDRHWPEYFTALDRLLAPGGRIALQTITMRQHHVATLRDRTTWITKYIFPGGLIPSLPALEATYRRYTSLRTAETQTFGAHYAHTLRLWRERFEQQVTGVAELGFDETFRRTWRLYLSMSEAGFTSGHLDVVHLVLERSP